MKRTRERKLATLGTRRNVRVEQKPQDLLRCFVHRSGSISLPNQERIGGRLDLVSKSIAIDTTHQISLDGDTALDPSGGPGRLSGRIVPCVGERENSLSQAAAIGLQKDCENLKMVAPSVGGCGSVSDRAASRYRHVPRALLRFLPILWRRRRTDP